MDTTATQIIEDAKVLCDKLWNGCQRFGNIRVPINGDTTRLPYADGLTARQKRLAREVRYKAQHFPGTQACDKSWAIVIGVPVSTMATVFSLLSHQMNNILRWC